MAQQVGVIATQPNDLGSVPGTHVVEGENQFWQAILCLPPVYHGMHRCVHT